MNSFAHLIDKKIIKIQRIDSEVDYEFYRPHALIFTLIDLTEKLILTVTNTGDSSDIYLSTRANLEADYGLEFNEHVLNELKPGDELNFFLNEKIQNLRIAEYLEPEIKGNEFVLKHGKIAGIELITLNHKILFQNNYGGWIDIDENLAELPNRERWTWK